MARLPRFPDLLTTANLCCGAGSILLASQGQLTAACWLVFAGAVFDVFDGLAARALGGGSQLGAQLDSLADMVTFGVAPAMLLWFGHLQWTWENYMAHVDSSCVVASNEPDRVVAIGAMILVVASAWRLAIFNIDTRQTQGFLGLPTPANGLFWVSMVMISLGEALHGGPGTPALQAFVGKLLGAPSALFAVCVAFAVLMLSSLPLPSLKFKHFKWQGNQVMYLLGVVGLVLLLLYGILAVPMLLFLYLLSPLWGRLFPKTP